MVLNCKVRLRYPRVALMIKWNSVCKMLSPIPDTLSKNSFHTKCVCSVLLYVWLIVLGTWDKSVNKTKIPPLRLFYGRSGGVDNIHNKIMSYITKWKVLWKKRESRAEKAWLMSGNVAILNRIVWVTKVIFEQRPEGKLGDDEPCRYRRKMFQKG